MLTSKRFMVALLTLLLVSLISGTQSTQAASSRSWDWTSWNVTIDNFNTADNQFHVTEYHTIRVTSGNFAGGDRSVDLSRLTDIKQVIVYDGDQRLQFRQASNADDCGLTPGIFCTFIINGNALDIYYNFAARTYAGETRNIRIEYHIVGALRSYADYDQFFWSPLATTRDFRVLSSLVTIRLPSDTKVLNTYAPNDWTVAQNGSTVTFKSNSSIGRRDLVEIGVNYPHDAQMAPPPWQANYDALEKNRPILQLGAIALSLLIGIGGAIFMLTNYLTKGRDPQPVVVPEYLTDVPSKTSPGVVGTLLDESADMQDIMGTLVDLARRGYLTIEQGENEGIFGLGGPSFTFIRQQAPTDDKLLTHEQLLLRGIFSNRTEVRLSDLRNKFYTHISGIKSAMYEQLVQDGYYLESPENTRTKWGCFGFAAMILGGIVFGGIASFAEEIQPSWLPFLGIPIAIAIAVVGGLTLLISRGMPVKTAAGSQEAAKWRAFRTYLANLKKYAPTLDNADELFNKYIGYAVMFKLDKELINQLSPAMRSMPTWYHTPYYNGPYYGGSPGSFSGGESMRGSGWSGEGGLNMASNNLSNGLNSMSAGLSSLLNSAASTMTSSPSSSGSGGGFSGGGSSGGGSAGGH